MKRKPLIATAIALASTFAVFTFTATYPVWAGDNAAATAPFIDKEFEVALRKHFQKRFFNFIDATDTQREQITSLLDERMEACRPQREKLKNEAIQLSEMMAGDASDEQVRNKLHELREVRDKLMDERMTTALKVRTMLKPEQRKAVSDKIVSLISGNGRARMLR
ncbi:MAG: Spy/CpxP family protein refolding chaperone [Candidatus Melainabacteria bacterium]|nr:Spy/CpxP family protein refolding chaperone [Candidatus Melainabacteria bacterium]